MRKFDKLYLPVLPRKRHTNSKLTKHQGGSAYGACCWYSAVCTILCEVSKSSQNLETLCRSYKLEAQSIGQEEMGRLVANTWRGMGSTERAPYERVANDELSRYMDSKRTFEALHRHYSALHYGAQEAGKNPRP